MTMPAVATRASRGERNRTPLRIGSSTRTCVPQASNTTVAMRTPNNVPPESPVRSDVSTRYVGQCQRYISYEMPPTQRNTVIEIMVLLLGK